MPVIYMIVATILWGGSFLLTKLALQHMSATNFLFLRFAVAAVFLLPGLVWYGTPFKQRTVIQGIWLGLLQVGMMFLQTLGLATISPTLSAFLSGFFIVFVLFIRFIVQGVFPSIIDLFSSLLCLSGLALLTRSYGLGWELGVLYTLGAAFFVALHTYVLDEYASAGNPTLLTFMQMLTLTAFTGVVSLLAGDSIQIPTQLVSWGAILFCGIFCSSVAFWLQACAQQHLGAFQIAMLLMLEPVFATILTCGILGEQLSLQAYIGIAMILGAITIINIRLKEIS